MPKDWRMCSPRGWPYLWFDVPVVEPTGDDRFPSAFELVDHAWQPTDLPAIVEYLDTAKSLLTDAPQVGCPFCRTPLSTAYWRSDGVWLWPEKLSHFVREHHVWLPNAFVAHIRIRGYRPTADAPVDWDNLPWPVLQVDGAGPAVPRRGRDRLRGWAARMLRFR